MGADTPEPERPDPPLRWPRDSEAENAEVHRATELDRLARWAREQRLKPLFDVLGAHGLTREDRGGFGRYVVPGWWPLVPPPESACPWCQVPGDGGVCEGCADAQAGNPDPPALLGWWDGLSPLARRLHQGACHGLDPWSGRAVQIGYEATNIDGVSYTRLHSRPPRTSLDLPGED